MIKTNIPTTQTQSLKAISFDGVISIIGFLAGAKGEQQPTFLECLVSHFPHPPKPNVKKPKN
jgi:hypothetical protein